MDEPLPSELCVATVLDRAGLPVANGLEPIAGPDADDVDVDEGALVPFSFALRARISRSISSIVRVSRLTTLSFCGAFKAAIWAAMRSFADPYATALVDALLWLVAFAVELDAAFDEPALLLEDPTGEPVRLLLALSVEAVRFSAGIVGGEGRDDELASERFLALARANAPLEGSSSLKSAFCFRCAFSARDSTTGSFSFPFPLPFRDDELAFAAEFAFDKSSL